MARKKKDAADSSTYVPRPAETEAEVLSMGFPNTGNPDRDIETHMNRQANGGEPPRERQEEEELPSDEEEGEDKEEEEELSIGGQRLRVRKDIAAVLRAQELQLSELRGMTKPPQVPTQQEDEPDPLADAEKTLFADPRGTLIKYGEALEKRITKKLTTQYQANRATDEYFKSFYQEHKDLATLDDTVRGVLRANLQEVAALNPKASRDRLAQLVRMQIDTIVQAVVPDEERREARRTTVEGATRGGTSRAGTRQQPRQEVVKSLSSVIRERKMNRANARTATR